MHESFTPRHRSVPDLGSVSASAPTAGSRQRGPVIPISGNGATDIWMAQVGHPEGISGNGNWEQYMARQGTCLTWLDINFIIEVDYSGQW